MTNESVMHTVEPGQRPAQLIRLVNTAQVNLTTKTPPPHTHTYTAASFSLLLHLGKGTGTSLGLISRKGEA